MARRRFVDPLTKSEQQALTTAYHQSEKRALRRRAHAILLSDQGHTINQISDILQVRCDAVSRWLIRSLQARFQEETGKTVSTVTLRRALKKK